METKSKASRIGIRRKIDEDRRRISEYRSRVEAAWNETNPKFEQQVDSVKFALRELAHGAAVNPRAMWIALWDLNKVVTQYIDEISDRPPDILDAEYEAIRPAIQAEHRRSRQAAYRAKSRAKTQTLNTNSNGEINVLA